MSKMNIVPRYAQMKIRTHNIAAKKTQIQAQTLRIKNEIRFLYKKKQQLNKELYLLQIRHSVIQNSNKKRERQTSKNPYVCYRHERIWDNKCKTRQKQQFPHHSFIT
jgi:hypothetical protein